MWKNLLKKFNIASWIDLENTMLSVEVKQRDTNTGIFNAHVQSKKLTNIKQNQTCKYREQVVAREEVALSK